MPRRFLIALVCALMVSSTSIAAYADRDEDDDDDDRRGASRIFNVLPPGQSGGLPIDEHSTDQIPLYDGLTPLFDNVTAADIEKYFKPEILGLGDEVGTVEPTPRPGLRIVRDSYDVPHVFGDQRADVMWGAGWVAAEDRSLLMEVIRGPARVAALDVPGLDAFDLAVCRCGASNPARRRKRSSRSRSTTCSQSPARRVERSSRMSTTISMASTLTTRRTAWPSARGRGPISSRSPRSSARSSAKVAATR